MTLHHWPFRIHWRPQQVQVAPLAPAAKVARRCFSLGAAAGTDGAPRQALAAGVGDVFGLVSRHHTPSIVCGYSHCQKKRQDRASSLLPFAVSATVLVPPSGSTKSQMTMEWTCVDERVSVVHYNRCPKLAESIVEIWEAILHTLLVHVTCRGFQFCILALWPMDGFVHVFKCPQIKGLCREVPMFVFCCFKSRFQTPHRNHAPVQQCTPCEPCTAFSSDR